MNFPVADTFEPGEPLLRGLDRPFRGARRSNNDGALAATVKPCVPGNFIEETNAVTRHLPPLFIFIEHYRCAAAPSYDPNQISAGPIASVGRQPSARLFTLWISPG